MSKYKSSPLDYKQPTEEMLIANSGKFKEEMLRRRTVRDFSDKEVPVEVIKNCIQVAGSAPSGANQQPWHFVVVSDPSLKKEIRTAAEKEEREFYKEKAPQEWLNALEHLGTDENKPFLEKAPYLIVIFERKYDEREEGKVKHYYTKESVGIAVGLLISAVHKAGLVSLTHTPSPMNFLNKILNRPSNEKPYLILVVGYPEANCEVPNISKKSVEDITTFI